jgi:hypothetical protein
MKHLNILKESAKINLDSASVDIYNSKIGS